MIAMPLSRVPPMLLTAAVGATARQAVVGKLRYRQVMSSPRAVLSAPRLAYEKADRRRRHEKGVAIVRMHFRP